MARTRSENYGDIQSGILAKAAELFATQGYERSSIADLAEACALSRGALYHYFDSKEAILYAMLDSHVRGLLERLQAAVVPADAPMQQLGRVIETAVAFNAASRHESVIILNDLASLGEREQKAVVRLEQQIVDLVADVLVRADTGAKITRATKKVYTMVLFGIINYTYTWYDPDGGIKPKQLAQIVTDLFLNGFLAASGKSNAEIPRVVRPLTGRAVRR